MSDPNLAPPSGAPLDAPKPGRRRFLSPRHRFAPIALIAGVASVVVLSLSMTNTLSAFTASITNATNTAGTGTLTMKEVGADGTTTCLSTSSVTNAYSCTTINKYGGNTTMYPGQTVTNTIAVTNNGTDKANAFTLAAAACTQTPTTGGVPTDMCAQFTIVITAAAASGSTYSGPATVYNGTAAAFNTATIPALGAVNAASTINFTFAVTLGTVGNTYQGLTISQPLTFTFTS